MAMTREQKNQEVEALQSEIKDAGMIVVTHYSGLTVKQLTDLRHKLRAEGGSFRVGKNTLIRRALKGTNFEGLADTFTGPTGMAITQDQIAAARVVHTFAKTNDKLVMVGGANSNEVLSLETLKVLATLPSLDALRGKLIGILQAPGAQLARLAQAYADKGGDAPAAA
jgi:large subunit ribosomal protein L10